MSRAADIRLSPHPHQPKRHFAPNDLIQAQRPFVDEFWADVLGTSYATSFVSNKSELSTWEHYVGDRAALIARVQEVYGVDITGIYTSPMHEVLAFVREHSSRASGSARANVNTELIGFENDGGLAELLRELELYDDYKVLLPVTLTAMLRKQFPTTSVDTVELLREPDCEVSGRKDRGGGFIEVKKVVAKLPLRLTLHVEDSGYTLDIVLLMRIPWGGPTQRTAYDLSILKQAALPRGSAR
jgi:hypothetical protein